MSKIKRPLFSVLFTSFLLTLLFVQMAYAYENTVYGFSITPPSSWRTIEETGIEYVIVSFSSEEAVAEIDVWVSNTSYSLIEAMPGTIQNLAATFLDFKLLSEESRVVGGLDCYELIYTATAENALLKFKQVYFVEDEKVFAVTCSAFESEFSYSEPDFDASISSFRVIPVSSNGSSDNGSSNGLNENAMLIIGIIAALVILLVVMAIILLKKRGYVSKRKKRRR